MTLALLFLLQAQIKQNQNKRATSSTLARIDVTTQTVLPRKHAGIKVSDCREYHSLARLASGSGEDGCVSR